MDFKIAVLAGDGIGPEISVQGVDVMSAVCEKFGHKVSYEYAICGADAIDKVGDPFPEATYQVCKEADAVLVYGISFGKHLGHEGSRKAEEHSGFVGRCKRDRISRGDLQEREKGGSANLLSAGCHPAGSKRADDLLISYSLSGIG